MYQAFLHIIFIFLTLNAISQDTQLSQYYHAPLYLNPALAGTGLDTRVGVNYRNQWPGLGSPYKNYSFWADHDFYKINSGIGILVKSDVQGETKLKTTTIDLSYAYQINISSSWTMKPALGLGVGFRNFDFDSGIYGDQLTNAGISGSPTNDPLYSNGRQRTYPDISFGTIAYNSKIWAGFSINHLNNPNISFTKGYKSKLPIKWSYLGGYKIVLLERQVAWGAPIKESSITPTFLYKSQDEFDQLDLGLYWIHHPFMAGIWYRGIPMKNYNKGVKNNESLVLLVGFVHNALTVGYSYDITISNLSKNSGGAHEIALIYQWLQDKSNSKNKKKRRPLPCPNLDIQYKQFTF